MLDSSLHNLFTFSKLIHKEGTDRDTYTLDIPIFFGENYLDIRINFTSYVITLDPYVYVWLKKTFHP